LSEPLSFSVVICAYTLDRWDDLSRAVASVRSQTVRAHELILVIDHNPELKDRAERELEGITVVENTGRRGLSDARNSGVRAASGSVVAFLDDDAAAVRDWLEQLAAAYAKPSVIGVGGSAEPAWDAGRPRWFPAEFDWVVGCSYRGMPTERAPVRNPLGCNMSFRRAAFEIAGDFNPMVGRVGTVPVGCEETEFCIRLARMAPGTELVYEPMARVTHRVPAARGTWRYFRTRCVAEGVSKAIVSDLAGSQRALATERRYAMWTLPTGVLETLGRGLVELDAAAPARASAIVGGLLFTAAGYLSRRARAGGRRRGAASAGANS
jgi:cellulose synthase/poly-beta-1,6-N-acetylglucosamine synthase-like glycosyltransferase